MLIMNGGMKFSGVLALFTLVAHYVVSVTQDKKYCTTSGRLMDKPDKNWCHECVCHKGTLECKTGKRICPSLRYFDGPTQVALKFSGDVKFYEKLLMNLSVKPIVKCDRRKSMGALGGFEEPDDENFVGRSKKHLL